MKWQQQIEDRIAFLQEQLESLDHYLPETYQYLMAEMDLQQRELMEYKVKDFYWTQENEQQHKNPHSWDTDQAQEPHHQRAGVCIRDCCHWVCGQDPLRPPQEAETDMTLKPITVTFDRITTGKIQMVQEAISEPTTYAKVLEGLIDAGFATALKTLYEDGSLTPEEFEDYQDLLPDYLRSYLDSWKPLGPHNL